MNAVTPITTQPVGVFTSRIDYLITSMHSTLTEKREVGVGKRVESIRVDRQH